MLLLERSASIRTVVARTRLHRTLVEPQRLHPFPFLRQFSACSSLHELCRVNYHRDLGLAYHEKGISRQLWKTMPPCTTIRPRFHTQEKPGAESSLDDDDIPTDRAQMMLLAQRMNKRRWLIRIAGLLALGGGMLTLALVMQYDEAPFTGRIRFIGVPRRMELELGEDLFNEICRQNQKNILKNDHPVYDSVIRVAKNLISAAGTNDFKWHFVVIQSSEKNAVCLPGGKVCIYSGILPIMRDESGLATVLSHEIAHAIARHSAETLTQTGFLGVVAFLLTPFLTVGSLEALLYDMVIKVAIALPYSRKLESEADYIGLVLMKKAGYDPSRAIEVWERMGVDSPDGVSNYLSTHPTHKNRIQNIRKWANELKSNDV